MRLLLLITLSFLAGCQSTNVSIDYDTQTDFSNYRYYSWQNINTIRDDETDKNVAENNKNNEAKDTKPPDTPPATEAIDPLITERVRNAVARQLANSGFQPATKGNPADIYVRHSVKSILRTEAPRSSGSVGFGRAGGNTGVGLAIRFPLGKESIKKDVTILVDFIDTKDQRLKWRGSKTLVFGDQAPEEISSSIEEAIAQIFSRYPPGVAQN